MTKRNETQTVEETPTPLVEVHAETSANLKAESVDAARRTITGEIITFNEIGTPSTGPTVFTKGSIAIPEDLTRVKLLVQHDSYSAAIGYLTDIDAQDDTIVGTFKVPESEAGDTALLEAQDGLRDGLSVGVTISDYSWTGQDQNIMEVRAAELREVSLVTIPAYKNARVTKVTASHEGTPEMTTEIDYDKLAASLAPHVAQITPPANAKPANVLGLHAGASLDAVAQATSNAYREGVPFGTLIAALSDLLPSDDAAEAIIRPQWIDEVWQASRVERPFFDGAAEKGKVEGLKVQGFKVDYTDLPKVDPYEGDKAEISSRGKYATIPVEEPVVRRAGGWDIDRALVDLGSPTFISRLLAAATDSYKIETEAWLVDRLLSESTEVVGGTTFAGDLANLGVAAVQLGARLSMIQMATDAWLDFAELTDSQVPWWLKNQGELNLGSTEGNAGKLKFSANPDLPDGVILAVDSRAYTPYELPNLIKPQAENIPNGGIDVGVFGYISAVVNDARAVLRIGDLPPAEGGEGSGE